MAAFAIVDLETTGNSSSKQDRIIEIGIVLIKEKKIVKEFSTLIYPEREIPPFISSLTGIDDEDVIGSAQDRLPQAQHEVISAQLEELRFDLLGFGVGGDVEGPGGFGGGHGMRVIVFKPMDRNAR